MRGREEDAWALIQAVMEEYSESEEVREHFEAIRAAMEGLGEVGNPKSGE